MEETEERTPESYDSYLTAQVLLSQGREPMKATVVGGRVTMMVDRLGSAMTILYLIQLTTNDEATMFSGNC